MTETVTSAVQEPRAGPPPPLYDPKIPHSAHAALDALVGPRRQSKVPKFDESLDVYVETSLDPRKQGQQIRTSCGLPHGTGRILKIAVFTEDFSKATQALENGALIAGGSTLIKKIESQGLRALQGAERCVADESAMPFLKSVARLLGPRGMMPNKKNSSLVEDVSSALEELKAGAVEIRNDRQGRISGSIGRVSFGEDRLIDNLRAFLVCVERNRPEGAPKGALIKRVSLSTTMGKFVTLSNSQIDPKSPTFLQADPDELERIRAA